MKWAKTMLTSLVFILMLFAQTFEYCKAGYDEDEKGWLIFFSYKYFN